MIRLMHNGIIYTCSKVSHNRGSKLIVFTSENILITVACRKGKVADDIFDGLLGRPWIDVDTGDFEVLIQ